MRRVWSDFELRPGFLVLYRPKARWLVIETLPTDDKESQLVCYNLLEGQLLVNRQQFGHLPKTDLYPQGRRSKAVDPDQCIGTTAQHANVQGEHERATARKRKQKAGVHRPRKAKPLRPVLDDKLKDYIHKGSGKALRRFKPAQIFVAKASSAGHLLEGSSELWESVRLTQGYIQTDRRSCSLVGRFDD